MRAVSAAVLQITSELALDPVLDRIVQVACELVDARYGALGIPDGEGGFARFITHGMSSELWDAIGPLPRTHGLLDVMLADPAPYRTEDISDDERFQGWPLHHPHMKSFLGVPIVSRGSVIGAFYLTDKLDAAEFTSEDQELVEILALHAATAITNAQMYERIQELSVVEERNRLARDLHDSVTQTLFSAVLTARSASILLDRDPERAKAELGRVQQIAQGALEEMRAIVFELRPAELDANGLVETLRKHADVLGRVYHVDVSVDVRGERRLAPALEKEIFRVAQEALNNAVKHSGAMRVSVDIAFEDGGVLLRVQDNGTGFDVSSPATQSLHLGLACMRERAEETGGRLEISSELGVGTTVSLEVPV